MKAVGKATENGTKSLFVFGLGFTSVGLCNRAKRQGWDIIGTLRNEDKSALLTSKGYSVHKYDPANGYKLREDGLRDLERATHVVTSIPPVALSMYDPVLRDQVALLSAAAPNLEWLGYLSSTGVYGDWGGDWVDEESEPRPCNGKGLVRLDHEQAWQNAAAKVELPLHIFRLAGIYGPYRSVVDALRKKGLSESQQRRGKQRFTSRCHVQDICSVLLASMAAPSAGSIYNVADDDPSPRGEVMAYAQQVLVETGAALPLPDAPAGDEAASASAAEAQQQEQQSSPSSSKPGGRSRGSAVMEEKRVRNVKIKEQLGITLQYPTYREGITAIINGCTYPFDAADLAFLGVEQQGAGP